MNATAFTITTPSDRKYSSVRCFPHTQTGYDM